MSLVKCEIKPTTSGCLEQSDCLGSTVEDVSNKFAWATHSDSKLNLILNQIALASKVQDVLYKQHIWAQKFRIYYIRCIFRLES